MVPVTLTFEKGGAIEVMSHVQSAGAMGAEGGHGHGGHGDKPLTN